MSETGLSIQSFAASTLILLLLFQAQLSVAQTGDGDGACSYLTYWDGTPVERNIDEALQGNSDELIVGGLGIRGDADLYTRWNATFGEYLTDTAGLAVNKTFKLVYLNFDSAYQAVGDGCVDLVFVNPSMYSCMELQFQVTAFVTLLNFRKGYELDRFYGTIFTRADRDDITKLEDLAGKIVEAVSISGLGACQLQWHELQTNGVEFLDDPKQVRFSYNQKKIVKDVIAGHADVGMVRTDMAEGMDTAGEINISDIKVINIKPDSEFPFPYSTTLAAPEWPLAALVHVPKVLKQAVADSLYSLVRGSDPTSMAAYAGWVPPVSYLGMYRMMSDLGWAKGGKCIRNADTYDAIICPAGKVKVSRAKMTELCTKQAEEDPRFSCPEGYSCVCSPCKSLPEKPLLITVSSVKDRNSEVLQESSGAICEKLDTCASVSRTDSLTMQVIDNWFEFRESSGIPFVEEIHYRWWQDQDASELAWQQATAKMDALPSDPEKQKHLYSTFDIEASKLGSHILEVAFKEEGGSDLVQLLDSPILLQIDEIVCGDENKVPNAAGDCGCVTGYEADGDGVCKLTGGSSSMIAIIAGVASCVVAVIITIGLFYWKNMNKDETWKISNDDLNFQEPVEVLGQGTFGLVVKATLRGTEVAVKRVLPQEAKAPKSPSGTASMSGQATPFKRRSSMELVHPSTGSSLGILPLTSGTSSNSVAPAPSGNANDMAVIKQPSFMRQNKAKKQSFRKEKKPPKSGPSIVRHLRKEGDETRVDIADALASIDSNSTASKSMDVPKSGLMSSFGGASKQRLKKLRADFVDEVKVMVYLRHPNITTVMGAVVENTEEPKLVLEYMKHRSLYEMLHSATVPIDADMMLTFCKDIVCGMAYLHQCEPPVLHNDLKSGNVLIDVSFRAKLTDFGLSQKKTHCGFVGTPFWMAPELLSMEQSSVKTDCYAMGVLLYEIFTRKEPYTDMLPEDVLPKVAMQDLSPPVRPELPDKLPAAVRDLITACWDPYPENRPSMDEVSSRIHELDSQEIADYLEAAKLNTGISGAIDTSKQEVLHKVFPPHISKALEEGRKIEPEQHDCVTIFFSDIVGFTDISKGLQPLDVMDMLDRLYHAFDKLATKHDVFKVETIGDAYMAVANLVKPQEADHAARIARFACDAVEAANSIPIKADDPSWGFVNIRVGFHSGPVVASVVGNLNPRYCLFGDTVNTSSRMESNSEKNRIHCSKAAADRLTESADFKCISRGEIPIKGKGMMSTFWIEKVAAATS